MCLETHTAAGETLLDQVERQAQRWKKGGDTRDSPCTVCTVPVSLFVVWVCEWCILLV